jgi:hypothetical protein
VSSTRTHSADRKNARGENYALLLALDNISLSTERKRSSIVAGLIKNRL